MAKKSKTLGKGATRSKKTGSEKKIRGFEIELEEKDRLVNEYLDKLKYLQAEFENYRKGAEKERENIVKRASEGLILKLLEVYESLEKALENSKDEKGPLYEGVEMIYLEFNKVLKKEGMSEIKAVGEKFDPFKHEALKVEKDETKDPNTIVEEYQKGYMVGDRVLRYSKVKVTMR